MAAPTLSPAALALDRALQGLLPPGAACKTWMQSASDLDGLRPAEAAASQGWHPRRQQEFAAGRLAARAVLRALGQPEVDLPPGPQRVPVWPAGVAMSLTHTDGLALAIGLPAPPWRSVGLDLALVQPYAAGLQRRILHPQELAQGETWPAALRFCIKEAVYKAQWTLSRAWMDFHDVVLEVQPGRFEARVVAGRDHPWPWGHTFEGVWAQTPRHVLALVALA